jgi:hypothetical protein
VFTFLDGLDYIPPAPLPGSSQKGTQTWSRFQIEPNGASPSQLAVSGRCTPWVTVKPTSDTGSAKRASVREPWGTVTAMADHEIPVARQTIHYRYRHGLEGTLEIMHLPGRMDGRYTPTSGSLFQTPADLILCRQSKAETSSYKSGLKGVA